MSEEERDLAYRFYGTMSAYMVDKARAERLQAEALRDKDKRAKAEPIFEPGLQSVNITDEAYAFFNDGKRQTTVELFGRVIDVEDVDFEEVKNTGE